MNVATKLCLTYFLVQLYSQVNLYAPYLSMQLQRTVLPEMLGIYFGFMSAVVSKHPQSPTTSTEMAKTVLQHSRVVRYKPDSAFLPTPPPPPVLKTIESEVAGT